MAPALLARLRALQRTGRDGTTVTLGLLALTFAVPILAWESFHISVLNYALVYVILALGLQLIVGYAGQLSLAHAAYFGLGAYTSAILTKTLDVPFWIAVLASALAAGLGSLLMSPIVRLRGHYFALATLAFGMIVQILFANGGALTGGWTGISAIPAPTFGPVVVSGSRAYYVLLAITVWVQFLFIRRMTSGRFGRALRVIRENELAAESVGVNAAAYKIKAIFVGCAWAGVAGSLMAHLNSYISPEPFSFWQSITMLLMVVVGGVGSLAGAVLGALTITVLDELMRGFSLYRPLLYGATVVLLMIFLPEGISGFLKRKLGGQQTESAVEEEAMEEPSAVVVGELPT